MNANLKNIEKIVQQELEKNVDDNPVSVNTQIYNRIFANHLNKKAPDPKDQIKYCEHSLKQAILRRHISELDKTRIKQPQEYYDDFNKLPIIIDAGSACYAAPDVYISRYYGKNKDTNTIAPITPLGSSPEGNCKLKTNTPLNDLISNAYIKFMYNKLDLDNCRHLIKFKINDRQKAGEDSLRVLRDVDPELYELYVEIKDKRIGGKNMKRNKKTTRNKRKKNNTKPTRKNKQKWFKK